MSDNYSSDTRRLTTGDIVFIIASAILFLGAIGIFIWLLVAAAEHTLCATSSSARPSSSSP